jgi:hypothetical protein
MPLKPVKKNDLGKIGIIQNPCVKMKGGVEAHNISPLS